MTSTHGSISTSQGLNRLSLRDILMASTIILQARNSKGRFVPLHLKSAPGVGKSMAVAAIAQEQARTMPGVAFGFGIFNAQIASPTDLSIVLFDEHVHPEGHPQAGQRDKVSVYTRPACFRLDVVYVADPEAPQGTRPAVRSVKRDIQGQSLYPGSIIRCPWTGASLPVMDGILFLDEFAQGDAEVRKALAPLIDEGRTASFYLPDGFAVWMASNRAKDQSGVGKALAFLTNREVGIEVERDMDGLRAYARGANGIDTLAVGDEDMLLPSRAPLIDEATGAWVRRPWHPAVIAFMDDNEDALHAGVPADPAQPFLTPRSLELVANLLDLMLVREVVDDSDSVTESSHSKDGNPNARAFHLDIIEAAEDPNRVRIFTALAAGAIGSDMAAQFMSTLALYGETPSVEEMAADPTKCHVSDKKDAQIISSYKIANGMTLKNGNALIRYAQRLNSAFFANTIISAVTRNSDLMTLTGVASFFGNNPTALHRMVAARNIAAGAKARGRR